MAPAEASSPPLKVQAALELIEKIEIFRDALGARGLRLRSLRAE
jgi:hypothetical protein